MKFKQCLKCDRIVPLDNNYCPGCEVPLTHPNSYEIVERDPDKIQDEKDSLELDRRLGK